MSPLRCVLLALLPALSRGAFLSLSTGLPVAGSWFEAGAAVASTDTWVSVFSTFTEYVDAVVFVSVAQSESDEMIRHPVTARVNVVQSAGQVSFSIRMFYPNGTYCMDHATPAGSMETYEVAWMVMERGGYSAGVNSEVQLVVGTANAVSETAATYLWPYTFGSICNTTNATIGDSYSPFALFSVKTLNNPTYLAVRAGNWLRSGSSCDYSWRQAELSLVAPYNYPKTLVAESVNYLLYTNKNPFALGCLDDGMSLEFNQISVHNALASQYTFSVPFLESGGVLDAFHVPKVFSSIVSSNSANAAAVHCSNASSMACDVFLQNDRCQMLSTLHFPQTVSVVVLGYDPKAFSSTGEPLVCTEPTLVYLADIDNTDTSGSASSGGLNAQETTAAVLVSISIVLVAIILIFGNRIYEAIGSCNGKRKGDILLSDSSAHSSTEIEFHTDNTNVMTSAPKAVVAV